MKVYTVVVVFHPMNAPQNYKVTCKSFPYYTQAAEYKKEKENEFPLSWSGAYNHVEMFEQELF